ncbi:MAG: 50S ribosomal protein L17 [Terriglobia bacterium]
MRHNRSGRKLKRTHSHRRATLAALSISLIQHKKIRTTVAKAKEARMFVEKLITRAKNAVAKESGEKMKNVHARREVFAFLRDRGAVSILFDEIAGKVASRPGGYTRVVKLGRRPGDGAELAVIELVDYSTGQDKEAPKQAVKASKADSKKAKKEGNAQKQVKKADRKVEAAAEKVK